MSRPWNNRVSSFEERLVIAILSSLPLSVTFTVISPTAVDMPVYLG